MASAPPTKAVLLVGGPSRGTRFRPLSLKLPKPLFDVAGHPIIEHALGAIAALGSVREVFIIGYFDESVFAGLVRNASRVFPTLSIKYLREYQALGTAGGLYHFRDLILKDGPERFFVINADVCCSFPLGAMLKMASKVSADAVILGKRLSNREAARHYGCIVPDDSTGRVLHYVEKPESLLSNMINCGVYLFSVDCIFPAIKTAMERRRLRPRVLSYPSSDALDAVVMDAPAVSPTEDRASEVLRLEQDILSDLADSHRFYVLQLPDKDFFLPIKQAASALVANALYLDLAARNGSSELATPQQQQHQSDGSSTAAGPTIRGPVFIHPTATVDPTATLGPHVSIGPGARIAGGARLKEAIVLDDAVVRANAYVAGAIIGWNSRLGAWSRVEGDPAEPEDALAGQGGDAVDTGAGTIVGNDCVVADDVMIQNCVCLPNKELKRDVKGAIIM